MSRDLSISRKHTHESGDIVDGGDHVAAGGAPDGVTGHVEGDGGRGRTEGDAQHRYRVALPHAASVSRVIDMTLKPENMLLYPCQSHLSQQSSHGYYLGWMAGGSA